METQMLLRDPHIYPSNEVLKNVLGDSVYHILHIFLTTITNEEYALSIEWRYYNDGKAWLGKIQYKKKTILWLSVWEVFFKTSFYFTEKHLEAIAALNISESVKDNFYKAKLSGRLIPMIIDVSEEEQLADLLTIMQCKKRLK